MEYAGIRGLEQKMYKEQETLKGKSHSEVHEAYSNHCAKLATHNAIFFPARVSEWELNSFSKANHAVYCVIVLCWQQSAYWLELHYCLRMIDITLT